jgi:hypothetical protein
MIILNTLYHYENHYLMIFLNFDYLIATAAAMPAAMQVGFRALSPKAFLAHLCDGCVNLW